jgi:hypothetical protein
MPTEYYGAERGALLGLHRCNEALFLVLKCFLTRTSEQVRAIIVSDEARTEASVEKKWQVSFWSVFG